MARSIVSYGSLNGFIWLAELFNGLKVLRSSNWCFVSQATAKQEAIAKTTAGRRRSSVMYAAKNRTRNLLILDETAPVDWGCKYGMGAQAKTDGEKHHILFEEAPC